MSNPSKKKGTGGEVEVLKRLQPIYAGNVTRTSPGSAADLRAKGLEAGAPPMPVLYTRPDHGQWLVTLSASDFEDLLWYCSTTLDVQVKRYARFSFHTIYEKFKGALQ